MIRFIQKKTNCGGCLKKLLRCTASASIVTINPERFFFFFLSPSNYTSDLSSGKHTTADDC